MKQQFKALSIKNWILFKRSYACSALQILMPLIFILLLILIRKLALVENFQQAQILQDPLLTHTHYGNPIAAQYILGVKDPAILKNCSNQLIALVPTGNPMAQKFEQIMNSIGYLTKFYASDEQVDQIIRDPNYGFQFPQFCFGVSFQNTAESYKYHLRFNVTDQIQIVPPHYDLTYRQKIGIKMYKNSTMSGIMSVTNILNNLILETQAESSSNMLVTKLGPIYQEDYIYDSLYFYLGSTTQFFLLIPLAILYLRQTFSMLHEKQGKIKQVMCISGMKVPIYYLTWFIRYFISYFILHLVGSIVFVAIFTYVPFYIPFLVFILFDIVLIIQSFFIQIFVTRAKMGMILALVFSALQYVINFLIANNQNITLQINTGVSAVPHVAFILAFKTMIYCESFKIDCNLTQVINNYTISVAIVSLLVNIAFWDILALYLEQVFPNQWGAKKHPLFCFRPLKQLYDSIFNKNKQAKQTKKITEKSDSLNSCAQILEDKYEQMQEKLNCVKIKNLYKIFGQDIHAVRNLNVNIYTDQIFVLLGHNGAGKTSTISMLTGMIKPTSGYIQVLGQTQIPKIRQKLGVCPQHDTLYDYLTVEEHIKLFATFRGLQGQQLKKETEKLVKDVHLQQKKKQYAKNLSGGQKRRLSVAMAFSGGAKVIILDEPTSGMDASARRYIWQMLKNYKNERIILLTTHFMDEADYLGDRIAIMSGGRLVALGSNVYLKNKYGVGYNLTFVKNNSQVPIEPIVQCISKHIPNLSVLSSISSELVIQLPMDKVSVFPQMFDEIDNKKKQLGYQTYGISITTLQQVFLKVAEENHQLQPQTNNNGMNSNYQMAKFGQVNNQQIVTQNKSPQTNLDSHNVQQEKWERQDSCCQRFLSHFLATILKRLRVIKRDIKSFLFELILPMAIILLALMLMRISFVRDSQSQQLTFKTYTKQGSPVYIPISSSSANVALLDQLQNKMGSKRDYLKTQKFITSSDLDFDKNILFAKKKQLSTLKGGIYFQPQTIESGIRKLPFTSIVNTRSPTSFVSLQTLAAQTYISQVVGKNITIIPINKPLPCTYRQLKKNNTISGLFGGILFSIALAFKFASIVAFIVKQRQDHCKHQQIISGMVVYAYWLGNFLNDFLLYLILAIYSIAMCQILQIQIFIKQDAFTALCLMFLFYGFANIPLTYILGYFFREYGNAQGAIYFFNFVSGSLVTIIILVLRWIDQDSNKVGRGLAWPLRIIPSFAFGQGLINLGSTTLLSILQNNGKDFQPFALQIALAPIIFLIVFGSLYVALVFVIQWLRNNERFMRYFSSQQKYNQSKPIQDSDVIQQQNRAIAANPNDYQILTKNLRKVYKLDSEKKFKVAVDNLSFGVTKGEVFGLLGVNGAGKTTTFKMLAGQVVSTSGQSYFSGLKISDNLSTIRKSLGYCPQFDALIERLTVREQLQIYYDMKCLPKKYKELSIKRKMQEMNLTQYENKLSGNLSGGNKRKLSVAIALIGNPHIIFLDEPSTGMDPKARRFMWKLISRISTQRKNSTVILTTHSMEEAEALSSRLGIMVEGNFKCIGTPQHIKSKYGKGFEIQVKVKVVKRSEIDQFKNKYKIQGLTVQKLQLEGFLQHIQTSANTKREISRQGSGKYIWQQLQQHGNTSINSIIQFHLIQSKVQRVQRLLRQQIGEIQILEHFQTYIRFKTPANVVVGKLFNLLETNKNELQIMQYSIKQATVEQIFNKFAQEDGRLNLD